jgi:hypothetical protein
MLAGLLGLATGPDAAFRWTLYLLLSFWPVAVYVGARWLGSGRGAAAAAAAARCRDASRTRGEQFPNGAAVLLRVFVELSVDHFIDDRKLQVSGNNPLAKRLKLVATTLESEGAVSEKLRKAVEQVANGPSPLAPGVSTFHQYVHNQYTFPKPRELYLAWDELQPFMEQVWP